MKKQATKGMSCERVFGEERNMIVVLEHLHIKNIKQILDLRVFDLMNMNRLDPICVEEILTCLYKGLNDNPAVDDALYYESMSQYFDYATWRKNHKDYSQVKVSDIVLADDINLYALQHIYDLVRRSFFKSTEYNSREYKYLDYNDYLKQTKNKGGKN